MTIQRLVWLRLDHTLISYSKVSEVTGRMEDNARGKQSVCSRAKGLAMITEGPRPIGAALNRNLGSPTAPGEAVEHEIDQFIERRHRDRIRDEGERGEEAVWRESERHHEAARRAENGAAWYEYHLAAADRLRATLGSLIEHHEAEAERYLPKGA